ncbi:ubiquitin-protein ligase [Lithospermum erythrorhizon]|uniref:RBR-type E3 ubiquitin transferase n=1 Tax=Lithospermum erythrorhizon TaxID=34254 RepID=A0AAV3QPN0_LITER
MRKRKKPRISNTDMDQINNTIQVQNVKQEIVKEEIITNSGGSILKEEIIKDTKERLKIHDNDIEDNGLVTLIYESETPQILSLIEGATQGNPIILEELEDEDDDGNVEVIKSLFVGECSNSKAGNRITIEIDDELGNYPPVFICEICTDSIPVHDKFRIKDCGHFYCSMCVAHYVASKIEENVTRISCPVSGCHGTLEPQNCRGILPKQVFDRWGDALCEGVILDWQKFYCPFKDCSALLIDDDGGGKFGGGVIRESECPNCRRLFCVQCKVPWHPDVDCADFQKLNVDEREREDILLINLAKNKSWTRCPKCKFYVERIDGCFFIHCRLVF